MSDEELVLAVPRRVLMPDPGWRGIRSDLWTGDRFEALVAEHGEYRPRGEVEPDRSWKQVIPYLVLRDGSRYFLMRRTRAGGDARLHDLWTIGVGGHLNPGDGDLAGGLRREWREEIRASFEPEFELIGLINDDATDVGSVHVGAVYVADARGREVTVLETEKLTGAFAEPGEVARVVDRMESWSALVFQHLEGVPA
jgi:predicted NUDIX family phosphoesterase